MNNWALKFNFIQPYVTAVLFQEYLEMQRQHALQRLQEQEREMQMRFEQWRQLTQIKQMQNDGYNQVFL